MDQQTRDLLLAADGDDPAFRRLVLATEPDIRRFCAWQGVSGADLDDAVQETFVRAHRGLVTFRGTSSARAWLLSIARRTCLDQFRRARREQRLVAAVGVEPMHRVRQFDEHPTTEITELIDQLPHDFKEAFMLVRVFGCSYDEAASIVGCPRGTIQSRVARARRALIAMLSESQADQAS